MRPLIVVEGPDAAVADAIAEARADGWEIISGWERPPRADRVVCTGTVATAEDAAAALLAAIGGAGLVVAGRGERDLLDRLCDDLRRIDKLDHRTESMPRAPRLTSEERALANLLLEGLTLGEAARRLNLSRRTADRRIAVSTEQARRAVDAGGAGRPRAPTALARPLGPRSTGCATRLAGTSVCGVEIVAACSASRSGGLPVKRLKADHKT